MHSMGLFAMHNLSEAASRQHEMNTSKRASQLLPARSAHEDVEKSAIEAPHISDPKHP